MGCQKPVNIEGYLTEQHHNGKLNGNVLVIQKGKILYENSFGYSNGSKETLLTKEYQFGIGSIYKEFPAVAIMQLKEKGLLNLNDSLSIYITNLPIWSQKILIKNLLQYSSGLPMIRWDEYFGKGKTINDTTILNDLLNIRKLEFEPGTNYLYSNNSPFLLKMIVEKISQQSFSQYVTENIFPVADLFNTSIKKEFPYMDKTNMAIPFNSDFKEDEYSLNVSGMLFTTTTQDLSNWFVKLNSPNILKKKSVKFLSEKVKDNNKYESPLGQVIWENDDLIEHTHHGSMANYECIVRYFKKEKIIITILTNQKNSNVYELSNNIYKLIKDKP